MRYLLILTLLSCSIHRRSEQFGNEKQINLKVYNYSDHSGSYTLKKELKRSKNRLISRVKLISKVGLKVLESQVSVSKIGSIKTKTKENVQALLPEISQFKVWFNKKEYFSQIKINRKKMILEVTTKSPEKQWNNTKTYPIPKGKYFCFFSQMTDCLKMQNLLYLAGKKKVEVFVIWDNFPYHNEQYEGLSSEPFTLATFELGQHNNKELKYTLDLGNQVIFYHFNRKLELAKMFWVSQGISLVDSSKE